MNESRRRIEKDMATNIDTGHVRDMLEHFQEGGALDLRYATLQQMEELESAVMERRIDIEDEVLVQFLEQSIAGHYIKPENAAKLAERLSEEQNETLAFFILNNTRFEDYTPVFDTCAQRLSPIAIAAMTLEHRIIFKKIADKKDEILRTKEQDKEKQQVALKRLEQGIDRVKINFLAPWLETSNFIEMVPRESHIDVVERILEIGAETKSDAVDYVASSILEDFQPRSFRILKPLVESDILSEEDIIRVIDEQDYFDFFVIEYTKAEALRIEELGYAIDYLRSGMLERIQSDELLNIVREARQRTIEQSVDGIKYVLSLAGDKTSKLLEELDISMYPLQFIFDKLDISVENAKTIIKNETFAFGYTFAMDDFESLLSFVRHNDKMIGLEKVLLSQVINNIHLDSLEYLDFDKMHNLLSEEQFLSITNEITRSQPEFWVTNPQRAKENKIPKEFLVKIIIQNPELALNTLENSDKSSYITEGGASEQELREIVRQESMHDPSFFLLNIDRIVTYGILTEGEKMELVTRILHDDDISNRQSIFSYIQKAHNKTARLMIDIVREEHKSGNIMKEGDLVSLDKEELLEKIFTENELYKVVLALDFMPLTIASVLDKIKSGYKGFSLENIVNIYKNKSIRDVEHAVVFLKNKKIHHNIVKELVNEIVDDCTANPEILLDRRIDFSGVNSVFAELTLQNVLVLAKKDPVQTLGALIAIQRYDQEAVLTELQKYPQFFAYMPNISRLMLDEHKKNSIFGEYNPVYAYASERTRVVWRGYTEDGRESRKEEYPVFAKRYVNKTWEIARFFESEIEDNIARDKEQEHTLNKKNEKLQKTLEKISIIQHSAFLFSSNNKEEKEEVVSAISLLSEGMRKRLFQMILVLEIHYIKPKDNFSILGSGIDAAIKTLKGQVVQLYGRLWGTERLSVDILRTIDTTVLGELDEYYEKFCKHRETRRVLFRQIVSLLDKGIYYTYRQWGANKDPQNDDEKQALLEGMKDQGLLPSNLTLRQYEAWSEALMISSREKIDEEEGKVIGRISSKLDNAIQDGHIEAEALLPIPFDKEEELKEQSGIIAELKRIGTARRKEEGKGKSGWMSALTEKEKERYNEAKIKREVLLEENKELLDLETAKRYIYQLRTLTYEEIHGDYLLDRGRKVSMQRVQSTIINMFSDRSPDFIADIGGIFRIIETQQDRTTEKYRSIITTDEVDFSTYFEIGENPVPSCQSYKSDTGKLAEGLMSTILDPAIRVFQVKNEDGEIIARSVARLLEDENGDPQIYLEKIYTSYPEQAMQNSVDQLLKEKADTIGLELLDLSESSVYTRMLRSKGTRGTAIYSDAGGGFKKGGVLQIMV